MLPNPMCILLLMIYVLPASCYQNTPRSYRTVTSGGSQSGGSTRTDDELSVKNPECMNQVEGSLDLSRIRGFGFGIVGGSVVDNNDPVALATVKVNLPAGHCTGTLIGKNQVVTAAHCFEVGQGTGTLSFLSNPSLVKLGGGVNGEQFDDIQVNSYLVHPCYAGILGDPNTGRYLEQIYYDVALLTFEGDLPSQMKPVEVATKTELGSQDQVTIAGYGAYNENDSQIRPLTKVDTFIEEITDLNEIQLEINGTGACFGDSGGPTFISMDGGETLKLVGSTTGPGRESDYSCDSGSGTMMDLTTYRGWIDCSLRQMGTPLDQQSISDNSSTFCFDNKITR